MNPVAHFPSAPAVPEAIFKTLGSAILSVKPVGSRVTCDPAPQDTDEDWLVLISGDIDEKMIAAGFSQDGSPQFYTGNDAGGFRSWRLGDINVIATKDVKFFNLFLTATFLAKRFNLLEKADRIALFQAVLYQVQVPSLETRPWNPDKLIQFS